MKKMKLCLCINSLEKRLSNTYFYLYKNIEKYKQKLNPLI